MPPCHGEVASTPCFLTLEPTALWSKTEKNTDKAAIQSLTVPRVSERSERASERVSVAEGASEAGSSEKANE